MSVTTAMLVAAALAVGAAFGGLMYKAWEKNRGDRELQLAEEAASRDHERHDRERSADLKVVDASRTASGKNWVYMAAVENFGAAAAEKVRVWIVDGYDETPIGLLAAHQYAADVTIQPGAHEHMYVNLGGAMVTNGIRFCLAWTDGVGLKLADGPMCPRSSDPTGAFRRVRWVGDRGIRPGFPPPGA